MEKDEINSSEYKSYFNGTKQLYKNYKEDKLKIVNNVRKFRKDGKQDEGYDEIFLTDDQQLFGGISKLISILYPPKIRGNQNKIGFRYYKDSPFKENVNTPYFTLIIIGQKKFQILEKQKDIVDNENISFFNDDLNCLDIILNIIKNKIAEDKDNLTYPSSTCEVLGFIYAIKLAKNNISNIQILEPYYPNPFSPNTMEECAHEFDTSKNFIEPILYNNHVSLILFNYKKKREKLYSRKNILFDMSSVHYNSLLNEEPIFIEEMRYNLEKYPKNNIQIGRSCSIWFYGSMLALSKNKIDFPLKENILYMIIQNIYELFNIPIDINRSKLPNREVENIDSKNFISYKMAFKAFIDVEEIIEEFNIITNIDPGILGKYQKLFFEIKSEMNLMELNYKYYNKIFNQEILNLSTLRKLRVFINNIEEYFGFMIDTKKKVYDLKKSLSNYNIIKEKNNEIDKLVRAINANVGSFKRSYKSIKLTLYSKEQFHKLFFGSSDIFLSLLED